MKNKYLRVPYYCAFETAPDDPGARCRAIVWQYGGAIKGAHQPYTVVHVMAHASEARLRWLVEESYPGIEYRHCPEVVDGRRLDNDDISGDAALMWVLAYDAARGFYGSPAHRVAHHIAARSSSQCEFCGDRFDGINRGSFADAWDENPPAEFHE